MRPRLALVLLLTAAGCASRPAVVAPSPSPPPAPDTVVVRFSGQAAVRAEVAATDAARQLGLMHRDRLDPDAGMLFLFGSQRGPEHGFWMFNTRLPLSIAYLSWQGSEVRVEALREMQPCSSTDQSMCLREAEPYRPGVPYNAALEVNLGWFQEHGVQVGSTGRIEGSLPTPDP